MIFSKKSMPLIERLLAANAVEGDAISELNSYMSGSNIESKRLNELIDRSTRAHNEKMDIWQRLQAEAIGN